MGVSDQKGKQEHRNNMETALQLIRCALVEKSRNLV